MIKKEKARDAYGRVPLRSFFTKEIKRLPQNGIRKIVLWWLKCFEIKAGADEVTSIAESVAKGRSVVIGNVIMRSDVLSRFLACISLSEFRMGGLIPHPQDLRLQEMNEISKIIGLSGEKVLKIHSYWQQNLRRRIFPPSSGKPRTAKD